MADQHIFVSNGKIEISFQNLILLVPPNFGGAREKCQGEFKNF
jgi:hypothetical protein